VSFTDDGMGGGSLGVIALPMIFVEKVFTPIGAPLPFCECPEATAVVFSGEGRPAAASKVGAKSIFATIF
jgi:hypothetical protein